MKMVAAAKLRRAQDRIVQMRPYAQKLTEILQNVSAGRQDEESQSAYAVARDVHKVLIVAVTSDKGLCGAFNSSVTRTVTQLVNGEYAPHYRNGNLTIMPVGKKALDYYRRRDFKIIDDYAELFGSLSFDQVKQAAQFAMDGFTEGKFDKVVLVYNEFKNVATQILRTEQFLPIAPKAEEPGEGQKGAATETDYIYEPDKDYIIQELIPKSLKIQFFKSLLESNAAEHGARMTAMDKATDNAGELLKELKLTYNRTRQAAITKEILEIVGGAEALSQG